VLLHLHMHAALLAFARYSEPNTSGHFRNAIVIHFVEGTDDSKFLAGYPADILGRRSWEAARRNEEGLGPFKPPLSGSRRDRR
jgi:hypothetical protein